jgi:hypothetical protein
MNNYENRDNKNRNDSRENNSTQLFVAKGRNQGMDEGALIEFIASETGIDPVSLSNPKVLDDFSFIHVPFSEAGRILDHFQAKAGEGRSVVSKAKRKTSNSGSRDRNFGRRDGGFNDRNDRGGFGSRNNNRRDNDNRGNGYGFNRDDRRGNNGNSGNYNRDDRRSDYSNRPRRDDY